MLTLGVAFGLHRLIDPDLFLQIAVGRHILTDPFSLGHSDFIQGWPGYPYVEDKWLPSVVVALLDRLGGQHGLMLYQVALCVAVATSWYLMARCWGGSPGTSVVAVALGLLASAYRLEPRPDTLSHSFLGLTLALVSGQISYRSLRWLVPVLFVVWVNVHGYFVNGLLVVGAAWTATMITGPYGSRGPTSREWALLLGLSLVACMVHPQGLWALVNPVVQVLALQGDSTLRGSVIEFSSSLILLRDVALPWIWLLVGDLLLAVTVSLMGRPRSALGRQALALLAVVPWLAWPPPSLLAIQYRMTMALWLASAFELGAAARARGALLPILFVGFTVLAVPIIRNLSLLPPLAVVLLAPAWRDAALEAAERYPARAVRAVSATLVAIVVAGAMWLRLADRLVTEGDAAPGRTGWGIDEARFGAGAVNFVEEQRLPGPLFNPFDNGGYLLYRLYPERRVFIAGNTSMYPVTFLAEYNRLAKGPEASAEILHARYGVRTAILDLAARGNDRLIRSLATSKEWRLVYLEWGAAVFVRGQPSDAGGLPTVDLAERVSELLATEAPLLKPFVPNALGGQSLPYPSLHLVDFLNAMGRPDLAMKAANKLWQDAPSERVAIAGGRSAVAAGRVAQQVPALEAAVGRWPESEPLKVLLALGLAYRAGDLLNAGRLGEAETDLLRMQDLTPAATGPLYGLAKIAVLRGDRELARRLLEDARRKEQGATWRQRIASDPVLGAFMAESGG